MRQIPLAIGPETLPTFESYVAGPNVLAVTQLSAARSPGAQYYLWGPQGSGKTHLLRAWASQLQAEGLHVGWFDSDDALPWTMRPEWAAVVVDGCDLLDEARQRATFTLYTQAADQGASFAAAGRLPPVDLALREDLRTRLGWGHILALQCLSEAEARAAMRREADRRGLFLSDEVMAYVMRRFSRDMKDMMALLDMVDHYSLSQGRAVTVPLLRQMIADDAELDVARP